MAAPGDCVGVACTWLVNCVVCGTNCGCWLRTDSTPVAEVLLSVSWLIVEIGSPQEGPARQRIGQIGDYDLAATVYDYSGHPRVLKARRKPLAA